MRKVEILTTSSLNNTKTNKGFALYLEGKKIWEAIDDYKALKEEKSRIEDLLVALGFKLKITEVPKIVIDSNYGIFPDNLDELDTYLSDTTFSEDNIEHVLPGEDYEFDQIYPGELDLLEDDSIAYDSEYDLDDLEANTNINWDDIEDFKPDDDLWE